MLRSFKWSRDTRRRGGVWGGMGYPVQSTYRDGSVAVIKTVTSKRLTTVLDDLYFSILASCILAS